MDPRGRVFGMSLRFDGGSVSSLVMDSSDLERGGSGLRRLLPDSMPVDCRGGGGTGTNNVEHELSPIVVVSMW